MERIVIIVRDRVGLIADVAQALADADVNIESLDTERTGEQGIITLTTDDTDQALHALKDAGYRAVTDDSLIFRLPDQPGSLARVAERFKEAGVNIQSLHILDPPGRPGHRGPHNPGPGPGRGTARPGLRRVTRCVKPH